MTQCNPIVFWWMWTTRCSITIVSKTTSSVTSSASSGRRAAASGQYQEQLFKEFGYEDLLGALQRFRVEHPYEAHLVTAATFLVDYPFANRLYRGALDVLEKFRNWGRATLLSDGDVVFNPARWSVPASSKLWRATCLFTFTRRRHWMT